MLRYYLPELINNELFGERKRYGRKAWSGDVDWERWQKQYVEINQAIQHSKSLVQRVNDSGYTVLNKLDLTGQDVLEIGAGSGFHLRFFKGKVRHYQIVDVCEDFTKAISEKCLAEGIRLTSHVVEPYQPKIPVVDDSQDVVLSFFSLEHLHPLDEWLDELFRVAKPGGCVAGAIPCEGGLAWGLGRWLTSKRHVEKNLRLDYKKIICWEHPNSVDEIITALRARGKLIERRWPFFFLPCDFNLVAKFLVFKPLH